MGWWVLVMLCLRLKRYTHFWMLQMDEGDHRHVWQWVWRRLQVFVPHAERECCVPFASWVGVLLRLTFTRSSSTFSVSAVSARLDGPLASPKPVCGLLLLVVGLPEAIQSWYRVRRVLSGMWCCLASFLMPPSLSRILKRSNQLNEAWA